MKKLFFSFLFLSLMACQNEKTPAKENTESDSTPGDSTVWKTLFDGTSVDAWRGYNSEEFPEEGWVVESNELIIKKAPQPRPASFGGDLITKEKFGNFALKLEFMVTDTANSGIFYFVTEEEGSPIWFNAPEYQILDDKTYVDMGTVKANSAQLTGSNYDLQAAPPGIAKPVGEWNSARIVHKDGHVEHWLNGQKACEYKVGSDEWNALVKNSKFKDYPNYGRAKKGHIGLQDHDYEVRFKNIVIREPL